MDGNLLLEELRQILTRFLVLPQWVAEALPLWILHTYAFELRDVCAYLGVESPARRCGKTTLLTILCQLANRSIVAANVSSPSFFRAIEGGLRSHGGRYEEMVPFIFSEPLKPDYAVKAAGDPRNFDIFDFTVNGTQA